MWPPPITAVVDTLDPRRLLPPREGSLILVLGGTAVLVISLTLALATGGSRLQRRRHPTPSVGPRPKRVPHRKAPADRAPPPRTRSDVHEAVLKAAARAGIGTPQVVTTNPGPHALVLVDSTRCRSPGGGCAWKRTHLERALRQFDPGANVEPVNCGAGDRQPCVFEIRVGDGGT